MENSINPQILYLNKLNLEEPDIKLNNKKYNHELLGIYIPPKITRRAKPQYVKGTLYKFMAYLGSDECAKHLCEKYEYIDTFEYGDPINELIYKYINKEICGPAIIFKKDKSDIDFDDNIQKMFSKISGGNRPKDIMKCYRCSTLMGDAKPQTYSTDGKCFFLKCDLKNKHSHYLCGYCDRIELCGSKNQDLKRLGKKFL